MCFHLFLEFVVMLSFFIFCFVFSCFLRLFFFGPFSIFPICSLCPYLFSLYVGVCCCFSPNTCFPCFHLFACFSNLCVLSCFSAQRLLSILCLLSPCVFHFPFWFSFITIFNFVWTFFLLLFTLSSAPPPSPTLPVLSFFLIFSLPPAVFLPRVPWYGSSSFLFSSIVVNSFFIPLLCSVRFLLYVFTHDLLDNLLLFRIGAATRVHFACVCFAALSASTTLMVPQSCQIIPCLNSRGD